MREEGMASAVPTFMRTKPCHAMRRTKNISCASWLQRLREGNGKQLISLG
jgi:hypothetical protein